MGGFATGNRATNHTELVSLDPINNPVPACLRKRRDYPRHVLEAVGASAHGDGMDPLVCGGAVDPDSTSTDKCYVYGIGTDAWRQSEGMTSSREQASSSLHPTEGFIITGGKAPGGTL